MGTRTTAVLSARLRLTTTGLLLALIALLAPLAPVGLQPAAAAGVVAEVVPVGPLGRVLPPGPGSDFPRMPPQCYQSDRVTLEVGRCPITRFGPRRPTLVAWGDSHAWMYLPALRRQARAERVNLTMVIFGSCPVALPLPRSRGFGRSTCENHNVDTLDYLRRLDRRGGDLGVLVGGFWAGYRDAYAAQREAERTGTDSGLSPYQRHMSVLAVEGAPRMFDRLGRMRLDVDLIGPAATVPRDARPCPAGQEPYRCSLPRSAALSDELGNRRWIARNLRAPLAGSPRLVDATPAYCSATRCRATVRGANTYFDEIHLGARFAGTLGRYFAPVFRDLT
jgi:hypothetical protein